MQTVKASLLCTLLLFTGCNDAKQVQTVTTELDKTYPTAQNVTIDKKIYDGKLHMSVEYDVSLKYPSLSVYEFYGDLFSSLGWKLIRGHKRWHSHPDPNEKGEPMIHYSVFEWESKDGSRGAGLVLKYRTYKYDRQNLLKETIPDNDIQHVAFGTRPLIKYRYKGGVDFSIFEEYLYNVKEIERGSASDGSFHVNYSSYANYKSIEIIDYYDNKLREHGFEKYTNIPWGDSNIEWHKGKHDYEVTSFGEYIIVQNWINKDLGVLANVKVIQKHYLLSLWSRLINWEPNTQNVDVVIAGMDPIVKNSNSR